MIVKQTEENKALITTAREAIMAAMKANTFARIRTLAVAIHQFDFASDSKALGLVTDQPLISASPLLQPQVVIRKITSVMDVLMSELKRFSCPPDGIEADLKTATDFVIQEMKQHGDAPFSLKSFVHTFWPLVRCIFRVATDLFLPVTNSIVFLFLDEFANVITKLLF